MHRVKRTGNYAVLPDPPAGGTPGFFGPGDPGTGVQATIPGYDWFNAVQEEIIAPILAAGLALSESNRGQLLVALNAGWGMAKSHGAAGYQRLPGGLILQWGNASATGSATDITLPLTYPSGGLQVYASDAGAGVYRWGAAFLSASQIRLYRPGFISSTLTDNVAAVGGWFRWFAIGY